MGYAILRGNYSKSCNCKFLNVNIALLRPLYCNFVLFRKKTNIQLTKIISYKDNKVLGNNISLIYIIIKIIFQDIDIILSERKIFNKNTNNRNTYMLLFMPYMKFIL